MEKFDSSCEPMDVDLSIHSVNTSHISYNELNDTEVLDHRVISHNLNLDSDSSNFKNELTVPSEARPIKTYHIKLRTERKKKAPFTMLLTLLAICAAAAIYLILDLKCTEELNLNELGRLIKSRVYDQAEAIDSFIDALSLDDDSKMLILYGSTGVGKTYTTSLLLESIWNSTNIYHFTMPSFVDNFSIDNMYGINICKTSIVIVDDLKPSDLLTVKEITLEIIQKSENLKKKITIILIINCDVITKDLIKTCDDKFDEVLTMTFGDVQVAKLFIKYEPLTQKTLRKCVDDVLGDQRISDRELISLMNYFDVTLDGCKGVYKKVQFLKSL